MQESIPNNRVVIHSSPCDPLVSDLELMMPPKQQPDSSSLVATLQAVLPEKDSKHVEMDAISVNTVSIGILLINVWF